MALKIPNFFEAFRGTPQGTPQGQQPPAGAPGTGTGAGGSPGVAANGMIPPGGGATGSGNPAAGATGAEGGGSGAGAPVDPWSGMWETAAKSQEQQGQPPASLFDIKPEQINEAAGKMQFTAGLQPELVKQALGGDINAFMQVINSVGQRVYAQTSFAGMRLMDAGINKFGKNFTETDLPKHFQEFTATHALRNANPVFADKKYAPMLETFKRALVASNPQASPQEIQKTAEEYLQSLVADVGKASPGSGGPGGTGPNAAQGPNATSSNLVTKDAQGNEDWSGYFFGDSTGAQGTQQF